MGITSQKATQPKIENVENDASQKKILKENKVGKKVNKVIISDASKSRSPENYGVELKEDRQKPTRYGGQNNNNRKIHHSNKFHHAKRKRPHNNYNPHNPHHHPQQYQQTANYPTHFSNYNEIHSSALLENQVLNMSFQNGIYPNTDSFGKMKPVARTQNIIHHGPPQKVNTKPQGPASVENSKSKKKKYGKEEKMKKKEN